VQGDRYIASDSGYVYVLKQEPFTSLQNWVLMSQGGVSQVNGQTGVVVLSTDDITEGVTNRYFSSGMTAYKNTQANNAHELVKLDGQGHVSGSILGTQLQLEGGFATIHDNQQDSIHVEESKSQALLLQLGSQGIVAGKKMRYA
jgi:hypothetical protein